MKSMAMAASLVALLATGLLAPPVEAATIATARIGSSYGEAKILVGTSTRVSIAAKNFRAKTTYTVALRRGNCSTTGALIVSRRMTTSSYGKITTSFALTTAQARLVDLPMAIRVGTRCGSFKALVEPGTFGDGTWRVGTTVKPGTYRTAGAPACHWSRLSGFGGTLGETIADNFWFDPPIFGSQIVRIAATDAGFVSSGCGTWRLQSEPPVAVPTTDPGDGTWRVGVDIQPGTYRAPGGPPAGPPVNWDNWSKVCRWARLSGFGGTAAEKIGVARSWSGPQIVRIAATDAGFVSSGCGTWRLQSEPPVAVPTTDPGDGTWRVGVDIQPGTYSAAGPATVCRWARLSGFGGTSSEIIAANAAGPALPGPRVLTIAATDAGFMSQDCGTWAWTP